MEDDTLAVDDAPDELFPDIQDTYDDDEDEGLPVGKGREHPGEPAPAGAKAEEQEEGDDEPEGKEEEPEPARKFNQLAAQHRILVRDNRILTTRFESLLAAINRASTQGASVQQAAEEELPEPDEDIGGHIVGRLQRIENRAEEERRQREEIAGRTALSNEVSGAYARVFEYRNQDPELYDSAVTHLAQISIDELREEYPDKTDDEIADGLRQQVLIRMLKWSREGKNPGEEFVKMAQRRGFNGQGKRTGSPKASDARAEITNERAREKKARTIASVSGAPARGPLKASRVLALDEDTWEREVAKMPLKELLKGKGRS